MSTAAPAIFSQTGIVAQVELLAITGTVGVGVVVVAVVVVFGGHPGVFGNARQVYELGVAVAPR